MDKKTIVNGLEFIASVAGIIGTIAGCSGTIIGATIKTEETDVPKTRKERRAEKKATKAAAKNA